MRRPVLKATLVLLSVGGLLTVGMSPALADGSHGNRHHHEIEQTVRWSHRKSVQIDRHTIRSGSIHFAVRPPTPRSAGVAAARSPVQAPDGVARASTRTWPTSSARTRGRRQGTRELTRDAWSGPGRRRAGHPEVVTEFVAPGSYYLMDLGHGKRSAAAHLADGAPGRQEHRAGQ